MHLKELKKKTPADLVAMAEEMGVEGASTMRKQDLMFSILKVQAENGVSLDEHQERLAAALEKLDADRNGEEGDGEVEARAAEKKIVP